MTRNPSTLAPSSTPLDRSLPDWQAEPWSATALHWAARLTPWKSMFVLGFVGMGVWLMDPSTAVTVEEAPAPPPAAVASPPSAKPVAVRVVVPPPAPKTADAAVPGPASAPPPISALPPSAAFDPFVTELQKPDAMFPDRIKTRLVRRVVLDPGHGGDNEGMVGVIGVR
jgi:N-acetylmuramoyl-L-alanine amidase